MKTTHATICLKPIEGKAEIVLIGSLNDCGENAWACQKSSGLYLSQAHYMVVAIEETGEMRFYSKTSHKALAETLLADLRAVLEPVKPVVSESTLTPQASQLSAESVKLLKSIGMRLK